MFCTNSSLRFWLTGSKKFYLKLLLSIKVAFESLHIMQKHSGNDDFMAIKLDISKTYDRVGWVYLEVVMRKLGFRDLWIKLMMPCFTTFSYSILINGEPKSLIHPSRGIR